MRVSQLARKLNVLPADVLAALPQGSVSVEGSYNARLTPAQVEEVVRFFRPVNWERFLAELKNLPEEVEAVSQPENDLKHSTVSQESSSEPLKDNEESTVELNQPTGSLVEHQDAPAFQEVEVIRAPKVELPGLRVVGKIEIPEKKKSEPHTEKEVKEKPVEKRADRFQKASKSRTKLRPEKNPIAIARERAQREAERQRRKEAELEKQRKTAQYLKKISNRKSQLEQQLRQKPKKETRVNQQTANPTVTGSSIQLSWWQRFRKWLFRE
ncbi:MAG: hypothetical protein N2044_00110 [Cyclobacteriaceae bacterium]|nr:hypothetical protein [Cyclobacteriaceae bacterium]MDW8331402.1 hypothetical protein [Cyclobacteriaceae bacterium]